MFIVQKGVGGLPDGASDALFCRQRRRVYSWQNVAGNAPGAVDADFGAVEKGSGLFGKDVGFEENASGLGEKTFGYAGNSSGYYGNASGSVGNTIGCPGNASGSSGDCDTSDGYGPEWMGKKRGAAAARLATSVEKAYI